MTIQLRKKPPFWCRAKTPDGKFVHLDRPLKDGEGTVCADCAAAKKVTAQKTLAPIPRADVALNRWNACRPPCPAYYGPNTCTCTNAGNARALAELGI